MANFILNVSDIKKNISSSKSNLKNYKENLNLYLSNVLNADSSWNDNNTIGFIELVKKDRIDLNEHIDCLTNYLKIIDTFCNSLNNTITSNIDISNLNKIKYNLDNINKLIFYINEIYKLVNKNYEILKNIEIPTDFKYYSELKQMEQDWNQYKQTVYNLKNNFNNIKNEIEMLISNTRNKIKFFNVQYISNDVCEHSYKISSTILYNNTIHNSNYDTNSVIGSKTVSFNNNNYQAMKDYKQAQVQIMSKTLNENNLNLGVDDKSLLNNENKISLSDSELKDNNYVSNYKISTDSKIIENNELKDNNINFTIENTTVQNSDNSVNLENNKINSNINKVEHSNNDIEVNLKSSTFDSVSNVETKNNIQDVNFNSLDVGLIDKFDTSNNIIDVNLN